MPKDRRYSEDQIKAIFKEAAEAQENAKQSASHGEGLTLAELQEIGKDAGITPEFIARATSNLEHVDSDPESNRFMGLPVRVSKTVDLPGPLSDGNWDRLIVSLRETFRAHGHVRREGSLREWRNGNLHAVIEPTETGHRIRLYTSKGSARGGLVGGLSIFAFGATLLLSTVLAGAVSIAALLAGALVSTMGLGVAGFTAMTLPVWELERGKQMEEIASLAVALAEKGDRDRDRDHEGDRHRHDSQLRPAEATDQAEGTRIDLDLDADTEESTSPRARSRER